MQLTLQKQIDSYSTLTTSITSRKLQREEIQVSILANVLSVNYTSEIATVSKAIVIQP